MGKKSDHARGEDPERSVGIRGFYFIFENAGVAEATRRAKEGESRFRGGSEGDERY